MAPEKLENLVKAEKLKAEQVTEAEIAGFIRSGVARLADAKNGTLNIESLLSCPLDGETYKRLSNDRHWAAEHNVLTVAVKVY